MDFIYLTVILSVILIIIDFLYAIVFLFDLFIRKPVISEKPIYVHSSVNNLVLSIMKFVCVRGCPILLFIVIFYTIFYIIYLIIITIIPDTGIQTLFIPLKDLLLKIPPLPALQEFGVFKLFDCLIDAFGMTTNTKRLIKSNLCFLNFSRDNIKAILKMLIPDYEINIGYLKDDEPNDKPSSKKQSKKEDNIVYKQIDNEVKICYKNNRIPYKIGMSDVERQRIEYLNNQEYIKCRANSIGKYIRII